MNQTRPLARRRLGGRCVLAAAGRWPQDVTGAGATFPGADLRQVGRCLQQGHRRAHQLPVDRLRRRHQADQGQDRRLRRLRHAAEGRGTGQGRPDAVPDRDRRRGAGGQHHGHHAGAAQADRRRCWATSTSARSPSGTTRRSTALNPGVPLPDAAIAVVRRADGSGTTFIFTNYLSKVNAEWKAKVGEGTAVNWPTGAGGKGNEGVSRLRAAPAELDRLRRVRLRQAEQDDLHAAEEPGRQLRRARRRDLQGRRRRRRLDQDASTRS